MSRIFTDKKFNILYSATAIAVMWAVWLILGAAVDNGYLVASPLESVKDFFTLFSKGFFYRALGATLLRALCAFAVSFVLALGCACLAAAFKPFGAFMRPVAALFRSMPTMAVLLLILVWLTPRTAPSAVAFLVLFPMIYSQLSERISQLDGGVLQMARVYSIPFSKKFAHIYLPHMAYSVLPQTGANISFALKLIISAEVMASTYTAIGGMMSQAQVVPDLARIAALTLVAVIFGIAIEWVFRLAARLLFKRYGGACND